MRSISPLVFLALTAALAILGGGLVLTSVKAHWQASCSRCGYDLRGHGRTAQCPECGETFEAVPDGFIERRHWRFLFGIASLGMAIAAFCMMFLMMIR